jgi:hypothetical protein
MHYKNGREARVGDWVFGISHNSDNKPICGLVVELMPKQGSCNIKIHLWRDEYFTEEGHPRTTLSVDSRGIDDYGDSKEFIAVEDGLRMVKAVVGHGNWNAPYLC